MTDIDATVPHQRPAGRYVALRDGEVLVTADTYDELSEQLERAGTEWADLAIEYVEPAGVVRVY